jgi:hypothetical protein
MLRLDIMYIFKQVIFAFVVTILLSTSNTALAAAEELDCALLIVTKSNFTFTGQNSTPTIPLHTNERMYVIWLSSGALTGEREDKSKISTSGLTLLTPTEDGTLTYTFTNKTDSVSCEAKVDVPNKTSNVPSGISKSDPSTLVIKSIPLLAGGTTKANETVPVLYLQVINIGTTAAEMSSLTLTQAGSAQIESIKSFSIVDDADTVYINATDVQPSFDGKKITLPVDLTIASGATRLLTVRTTLAASKNLVQGTTIRLNVTDADMKARERITFPINGVTWTIIN